MVGRPGMGAYTCDPSTQEAEVGRLRVQGQPGLHIETSKRMVGEEENVSRRFAIQDNGEWCSTRVCSYLDGSDPVDRTKLNVQEKEGDVARVGHSHKAESSRTLDI
jgi:hypothetical protein